MKRKSGKFSDLIKFLRETAELEEFNQAINYFRKQNELKIQEDLKRFKLNKNL